MPIAPFLDVTNAGQDDATFLATLKTAYADLPDGATLDFSPVVAYWNEGIELPASHRRWLGQRLSLEDDLQPCGEGACPVCGQKEAVFRFLYGGPADGWQSRRERWLTLLVPLLPAGRLLSFICCNVEDYQLPHGLPQAAVVERNLADTGSLLRRVAAGEAPWREVAAWFGEAGADLAAAESLTAKLDLSTYDKYDAATADALLVLYRFGVEIGDAAWWRRLAVALWASPIPVCAPIGHDGSIRFANALYRPLLPILLADPVLFDELARENGLRLWSEFGFAAYCFEQPQWFDWLAARPPGDGFRELWLYESQARDYALRYPESWLRYLNLLHERGLHFPTPLHLNDEQMKDWGRQMLPLWLADSGREQVVKEITARLVRLLPAEELVATLLLSRPGQFFHFDEETYASLITPAALRLVFEHPDGEWLRRLLARPFVSAVLDTKKPSPELRALLKTYSAVYPDLFANLLQGAWLQRDDPERVTQLWRDADDALKPKMLWQLLIGLDAMKQPDWRLSLVREGWRSHGAALLAWLDSQEFVYTPRSDLAPIRRGIAASRERELFVLLPVLTLKDLKADRLDLAPLRLALTERPELWDDLDDKSRYKLLPLLDDASALALGARLKATLAAGKTKTARDAAAGWLKTLRFATFAASGLLENEDPVIAPIVMQALGGHSDPQVMPWLRQWIVRPGLEPFLSGLLLDRLVAGGDDPASYERDVELSLDDLRVEAGKAKIPASVKKRWNEDFARVFEPLGEEVGLWCLSLIELGRGQELLRQARQLIERLPPAKRADLTELTTAIWVAENGADAVGAAMVLVPLYGDERVVNLLVKAVKAWCKTRKAKANAALDWMAKTPGLYGPAQVHALWESRKFSESVQQAAWNALLAAAAARGVGIQDFLDELVPDFGLGRDGLVLDVGPYHYRVRLFPDFSLKVEDEKGKLTASLPKAKAGEDSDKRGVAEQRLKTLSKNLKPLQHQQSQKLKQALATGKVWPVAYWRRLFLDHPILAALARGLTWTALDVDGQPMRRFRPTESATLVDLEDQDVTLEGVASLRLTHPVEVDAAERERWSAHFDDYAVTPTFPQWQTSHELPTAEEMQADALIRHRGHVLNGVAMERLLETWGYRRGEQRDGGYICSHCWKVDERYSVWLHHTGTPPWLDTTRRAAIRHFQVCRVAEKGGQERPIALAEVPAALVATVLAQSQALSERGEGFNSDWERIS